MNGSAILKTAGRQPSNERVQGAQETQENSPHLPTFIQINPPPFNDLNGRNQDAYGIRFAADIARTEVAGGFLDLMKWRIAHSNPVAMADDHYVLKYRLLDEGKNRFSSAGRI